MQEAFNSVNQSRASRTQAVKIRYDRNVRAANFAIGDQVLVRDTATVKGVNKKLAPKYKGPYKVIGKLANNVDYIIKGNGVRGRRMTIHTNRLKRWFGALPTMIQEAPERIGYITKIYKKKVNRAVRILNRGPVTRSITTRDQAIAAAHQHATAAEPAPVVATPDAATPAVEPTRPDNQPDRCRIELIEGDLFETSGDVSLAHCVSQDLTLGKGIAQAFREKFNHINEMRDMNKQVGEVAYFKFNNRIIFNMITKKLHYHKPTYTTVQTALRELRRLCGELQLRVIAMPRIACGRDQLKWSKVLRLIEDTFKDVDMVIRIYSLPEPANQVSAIMSRPQRHRTPPNRFSSNHPSR